MIAAVFDTNVLISGALSPHGPPGRTHSQKLPDPDDAPFLECAAALEVPLVTGNLRHYPKSAARDVEVLSPAAY